MAGSGLWDSLGADWLGGQPLGQANVLRAQFDLPWEPIRARLYIAGFGAHKSYLNGQLTDAHELGPFTQYQYRLPYLVVDVVGMLAQGCNTLGVVLGGGRYIHGPGLNVSRTMRVILSATGPDNSTVYYVGQVAQSSVPRAGGPVPVEARGLGKLHPQVTATVQPLSFLSSPGPIVSDDVFDGESYDARLEQDGWDSCGFTGLASWLRAVHSPINTTGSPAGGPVMSSLKVWTTAGRTYSTMSSPAQPYPGVYVADAGQGMAGYCAITIPTASCPAGQSVKITYGETRNADGTVADCRLSSDTYTCAGPGPGVPSTVRYAPSFSYRGYRYIQVEGYPGPLPDDALQCYFLHADVSPSGTSSGSFSSGNALLNSIQHAVQASALSNLYEVPTDDPNRSRAGWLGDAHLASEINFHNVGADGAASPLAAYYRTWLDSVRDTQLYFNTTYATNGTVPDELPWFSPTRIPGDMIWSAAYPLVVHRLWDYYHDDAVAARHYPGVQALMEVHITDAASGWDKIVSRYGDWCAVYSGNNSGCTHITPASTYLYYITSLDAMVDLANATGRATDAARYSGLAAQARLQFQANLFNASACSYGTGLPLDNAAALLLGVVQPSSLACVVQAMVQYYSGNSTAGPKSMFPYHMDGGILSTKHVWPVLSDGGAGALALTMALQSDFPSYGYWLASGGTTLFERWQNTMQVVLADSSLNHIMFGGVGQWLYSHVGGITRVPGYRSWTNLTLRPQPDARLGYAQASIDTPVGMVASGWVLPQGPASTSVCGSAVDGQTLTLACLDASGQPADGSLFTGVTYASYGNPTGSCATGQWTTGSCTANVSVSVVEAACMGKPSCLLVVSPATFGGVDPCPGHQKTLAVQLAGNGKCATMALSASAQLPVVATGTVSLPLPGLAPDSTLVYVNGQVVWRGGANAGYVPGAQGITGAQPYQSASGAGIEVFVGSGTYEIETWGLAG